MFADTANSQTNPRVGATERCLTQLGSCLTPKHQASLERFASGKNSSLFGPFLYYGSEKFYNILPWLQISTSNLSIFNKVSLFIKYKIKIVFQSFSTFSNENLVEFDL